MDISIKNKKLVCVYRMSKIYIFIAESIGCKMVRYLG